MTDHEKHVLEWVAEREVRRFLYREAALADAHDYESWLALWTSELLYWVPANSDDVDPGRKVSLIYDDRKRLEDRLFRLGTAFAHAQRPRSRLLRTVSNIDLLDYDSEHGGTVQSHFLIGELRRDEETWWIGRARHLLVRQDGHLRMKEKHVFLLRNGATVRNLTFVI